MGKYLDYNAPIIPGGSFTWGEYAKLPNWGHFLHPTEAQKKNAIFLFEQLQPLRKLLNKPLIITSGARDGIYTMDLRRRGYQAGLQSAHIDWRAVDLQCPSMKTIDLWKFFHDHWLGRMENYSATPGWVHLDTREWGQKKRFNP